MLSLYMEELKKIELLTLEEEKALWVSYKEEQDGEARGKLIEQYQPLVFREALVYRDAKADMMDLIQEGTIGLIEAVERFDHTKEVAFSLYAVHRIRGRILDFLRLEGRSASIMGASLEEDGAWWEQMPSQEKPLELTVEEQSFTELVLESVRRLPGREQLVVEEFYLGEKSIKHIAEEMDISQSYISRLQKRGIKRLRGMLSRARKDWKSE